MSESWEKQISALQTDIRHMLHNQEIMQKQIRDLQRMSNMGAGGLKVLIIVGACLAAMYTWVRLID